MQVYKCKNWLCNFEKTEHPLQSQDPTVTWAAHGSWAVKDKYIGGK